MRARDEAGSPAAGIEADFSELAQLAGELHSLADELSRSDSVTGHMDDPDLAGELARVERNWGKHRVTLQTFLDRTAASVAVSLTAYRQLERGLAQTAATGTDWH
jgi:hypothetical protein